MIDVSGKFNTLRYARAEGKLFASAEALERVRTRTVPKGDVLEVARAGGIQAAKRAADWMVFCHVIPLDWVDVTITVHTDHLQVVAEVRTVWKTGVEMEAMAAVSGALLNAYDMLKPLTDELEIGAIRLVEKRGGKSSFRDAFAEPLRAAVLVISDSTYAGKREDKSGKVIQRFLATQPIDVQTYEILPDDEERIAERLRQLADEAYDLVFTTGGTGLGPKDRTPEATRRVVEREVPGIAEAIRQYGKERTPYAMLSREVVGLRGNTLIINLPGSSRGAQESLQALFPGLLHAFPMLWGGGHEKKDNKKLWKKSAGHTS